MTGEERVRISLPASGILRIFTMGSRRLRSPCLLPWWLTTVLLLVYSAPLSAAADEVWRGPHLSALEAHRQHPVLAELIGDGTRPTRPMRPAAKGTAARPVVFGFLPYWIDATYYYSIDWELLTHIAPFSVEVNTDGSLGDDRGWPWTALIDAAHNGNRELVELLIKHGAEVVTRTPEGHAAIDYAAASGHGEIVRRLAAASRGGK